MKSHHGVVLVSFEDSFPFKPSMEEMTVFIHSTNRVIAVTVHASFTEKIAWGLLIWFMCLMCDSFV